MKYIKDFNQYKLFENIQASENIFNKNYTKYKDDVGDIIVPHETEPLYVFNQLTKYFTKNNSINWLQLYATIIFSKSYTTFDEWVNFHNNFVLKVDKLLKTPFKKDLTDIGQLKSDINLINFKTSEEITDLYNKFEYYAGAYKIKRDLYSTIKNEIDTNIESKKQFYDIGRIFYDLPKEKKQEFYEKIASFKSESNSKSFINYFKSFSKGLGGYILSEIKSIIRNKTNSKVVYEDDDKLVVQIYNLPDSHLLGKETSWCISINPNNKNWQEYETTFIRNNILNTTYFLWDTSKDPMTRESRFACTIRSDNTYHTGHYKNDNRCDLNDAARLYFDGDVEKFKKIYLPLTKEESEKKAELIYAETKYELYLNFISKSNLYEMIKNDFDISESIFKLLSDDDKYNFITDKITLPTKEDYKQNNKILNFHLYEFIFLMGNDDTKYLIRNIIDKLVELEEYAFLSPKEPIYPFLSDEAKESYTEWLCKKDVLEQYNDLLFTDKYYEIIKYSKYEEDKFNYVAKFTENIFRSGNPKEILHLLDDDKNIKTILYISISLFNKRTKIDVYFDFHEYLNSELIIKLLNLTKYHEWISDEMFDKLSNEEKETYINEIIENNRDDNSLTTDKQLMFFDDDQLQNYYTYAKRKFSENFYKNNLTLEIKNDYLETLINEREIEKYQIEDLSYQQKSDYINNEIEIIIDSSDDVNYKIKNIIEQIEEFNIIPDNYSILSSLDIIGNYNEDDIENRIIESLKNVVENKSYNSNYYIGDVYRSLYYGVLDDNTAELLINEYANLKKSKVEYKVKDKKLHISTEGYEELCDLLSSNDDSRENSDSQSYAKSVFDNSAFEYNNNDDYSYHIDDIDDIDTANLKNIVQWIDDNKADIESEIFDNENWKEEFTTSELQELLDNYEDEMYELDGALKRAIGDAQTSANESEAYKAVRKAIDNVVNVIKIDNKLFVEIPLIWLEYLNLNDNYSDRINIDTIDTAMSIYDEFEYDGLPSYGKIDFPYDGFYGTVTTEDWNECLLNQLDDL